MATLREVARQAGVSVATASRVASGSLAVHPDTRERVERTMRELLYVPPGRKRSTNAIGLLVPELANPIFPSYAQEMEAHATAAGFASILCNTHSAAFREVDYVHMLLDHEVEGMIFVSCEMTNLRGDHGHYARLAEEGARLVFVNGGLNWLDVPTVGVDERFAGQLATEHLIELGHRRIGFVAGPGHYLPTREKAAGWHSSLMEARLETNGLVANGDFSVEGGFGAAQELLHRRPERPTGVICSSDQMAIGVLRAAADAGLCVPHDFSVVGFDGIDAGAWTQPPLTTIEQPIQEIATTAVDALRSLIESPRSLPSSYFRPRLLVRGSTAPPPAA